MQFLKKFKPDESAPEFSSPVKMAKLLKNITYFSLASHLYYTKCLIVIVHLQWICLNDEKIVTLERCIFAEHCVLFNVNCQKKDEGGFMYRG